MADDAVFRRCLLCLAVVIIVVGYNTLSFKKMLVTYFVGLAAISGVLLPDWDFFDRDPFQWTYPLTVDQINRSDVLRNGSTRSVHNSFLLFFVLFSYSVILILIMEVTSMLNVFNCTGSKS